MGTVDKLIQRVQETKHGFLDIQKAADEVAASLPGDESLQIAKQLFSTDIYQARCLATFILGQLAARSTDSFAFLKEQVSKDEDWRVQEILAKAFDKYCADSGYKQSLSVIDEWLSDPLPNIRRAVTEGLRIWTGRPYFREHPEAAIQRLSQLRDDNSEYVRKSVGNALRDISKKHEELIKNELLQWDTTDKKVAQTYKLAIRFIQQHQDQA